MQAPHALFVLAGMPRAGTTYVYHALTQHPRVFVGARKERRYFSLNYSRGLAWYRRQFAGAGPDAILADLSPDYFIYDGVVARLREFAWPPRVAIAVRDPAEWVVSLHRHLQTLMRRMPSFPEFIEAGCYPDCSLPFGRRPDVRAIPAFCRQFVSRRLQEFRVAFDSNLLLYDFAYFQCNRLAVLSALESFMGAPHWLTPERLPRGRFNARSRGGFSLFRFLLSRELISRATVRLVPYGLLLRARRWSEREALHPSVPSAAQSEAEIRDIDLAREALAPDIAYVKSLFANSPIIWGDGSTYSGKGLPL